MSAPAARWHHPGADRWHDADALRWAARHWAARIGVRVKQIHLRAMPNKWASISTAGRLTLSLSLLELPPRLGEFVIVHELAHLLAPNHGPVFKSYLHAYLPDWQDRERELRHASARARAVRSEGEERLCCKKRRI